MGFELKETYFRRFFIPIVISILILCGIGVIVMTPIGTEVKWDTAISAVAEPIKGGFRTKIF